MATINKEGLDSLATRRQDDVQANEALSTIDYAPSLHVLQKHARVLGAFNIENSIGRFDPERITFKQRGQMRRDPMIALGLHFRKSTLVNAPWHIECDDPQVAAFADWALRGVYTRLLTCMFMALEWGFVPIVKRFGRSVPTLEYEDQEAKTTKPVWPSKDVPAVVWKGFFPLHPEGAEAKFAADGHTFDGFEHNLITNPDGTRKRVPASHALWVTHQRDENFMDWYGYPLTGYAFRYWWSYWYQFLLADRHMEQDADPPVKASYPTGKSLDPDTNAQVDNYQIALKAGQMLRDGATVAVPSDFYEVDASGAIARGARKWDMEFIRGGENIRAFHESFQYLDVMKLRSMLIPDQALTGARGSLSGNVAETYSVAFEESQALLAAWVDQHINDYMLPDLIAQNFNDAPECLKVTERFRDKDAALANRLVEIVAASDPSSLEVNYRKLVQGFNLPTLSMAEVEQAKKDAFEKMKQQAELKQPPNGPPANVGNTDQNNAERSRIASAKENPPA